MTLNAMTAANFPDDVYRDLADLHSTTIGPEMVTTAAMIAWRREG